MCRSATIRWIQSRRCASPVTPDEDLSILTVPTGVLYIQHSAQRRKSRRAVHHPPAGRFQILADLGMGPIVVAAGLLHDTVETRLYVQMMRAEFGDTVAGLVDGVTRLESAEDR